MATRKRTKRVYLSLTDLEFQQAQALAAVLRCSVPSALRRALESAYESMVRFPARVARAATTGGEDARIKTAKPEGATR